MPTMVVSNRWFLGWRIIADRIVRERPSRLTLSKRHTVNLPTTSGMTTQTLRCATTTSPGYDQR